MPAIYIAVRKFSPPPPPHWNPNPLFPYSRKPPPSAGKAEGKHLGLGKMVLAQLGGSISRSLAQMSNATVIDEKVLNDCLNEISRALLQADVQFKMVRDMQANIKRIVNLEALAAGTNKRRIMQQVRGVLVRRLICAIRAQSVKSLDFCVIWG